MKSGGQNPTASMLADLKSRALKDCPIFVKYPQALAVMTSQGLTTVAALVNRYEFENRLKRGGVDFGSDGSPALYQLLLGTTVQGEGMSYSFAAERLASAVGVPTDHLFPVGSLLKAAPAAGFAFGSLAAPPAPPAPPRPPEPVPSESAQPVPVPVTQEEPPEEPPAPATTGTAVALRADGEVFKVYDFMRGNDEIVQMLLDAGYVHPTQMVNRLIDSRMSERSARSTVELFLSGVWTHPGGELLTMFRFMANSCGLSVEALQQARAEPPADEKAVHEEKKWKRPGCDLG